MIRLHLQKTVEVWERALVPPSKGKQPPEAKVVFRSFGIERLGLDQITEGTIEVGMLTGKVGTFKPETDILRRSLDFTRDRLDFLVQVSMRDKEMWEEVRADEDYRKKVITVSRAHPSRTVFTAFCWTSSRV